MMNMVVVYIFEASVWSSPLERLTVASCLSTVVHKKDVLHAMDSALGAGIVVKYQKFSASCIG